MSGFEIEVRAPFDFAATARFLRFTEHETVDLFEEGKYRRALDCGGRLCLLEVEAVAGRLAARTRLEKGRPTKQLLREAERAVRCLFSPEHDLEPFRQRAARDPLMRALEREHRGLRLARWPSLFEALVISILSQQIATKVAMVLKRRFVERFGKRVKVGGREYIAFPAAATVASLQPDDLRPLGIAASKAASIVGVARAIEFGEVEAEALARQDNETIISRLTSLRGVGRWTADWTLILHFGRTDVYPAGDLVLRAMVEKYYGGGRPLGEKGVRALAEDLWGEWASYAAIYLVAGLRAGRVTVKPNDMLSSNGR